MEFRDTFRPSSDLSLTDLLLQSSVISRVPSATLPSVDRVILDVSSSSSFTWYEKRGTYFGSELLDPLLCPNLRVVEIDGRNEPFIFYFVAPKSTIIRDWVHHQDYQKVKELLTIRVLYEALQMAVKGVRQTRRSGQKTKSQSLDGISIWPAMYENASELAVRG